jgi:bifunctional DNase/RNase
MAVQVQLARIIISEITDNQVIYLKELDGPRQFPILIGFFEAKTIDRRVTGGERPVRPLTHDLLLTILEQLGASIERIVICDLKESTYFAQLEIRHPGGLLKIDSRPSDAIAIAYSHTPPIPIFVDNEVMERASQ